MAPKPEKSPSTRSVELGLELLGRPDVRFMAGFSENVSTSGGKEQHIYDVTPGDKRIESSELDRKGTGSSAPFHVPAGSFGAIPYRKVQSRPGEAPGENQFGNLSGTFGDVSLYRSNDLDTDTVGSVVEPYVSANTQDIQHISCN